VSLDDNMAYSKRFLKPMKRIVGEHLIGEAPYEDDTQRNTDLVVLKVEPVRVACRVRRFEHFKLYGDQVTFRAELRNGEKTELHKVMEGWGDYFLYAFADRTDTTLFSWVLGDLHAFRSWLWREMLVRGGRIPGELRWNRDKQSALIAFSVDMIDGWIKADGRKSPLDVAIAI
jgi:hypothetical protein